MTPFHPTGPPQVRTSAQRPEGLPFFVHPKLFRFVLAGLPPTVFVFLFFNTPLIVAVLGLDGGTIDLWVLVALEAVALLILYVVVRSTYKSANLPYLGADSSGLWLYMRPQGRLHNPEPWLFLPWAEIARVGVHKRLPGNLVEVHPRDAVAAARSLQRLIRFISDMETPLRFTLRMGHPDHTVEEIRRELAGWAAGRSIVD